MAERTQASLVEGYRTWLSSLEPMEYVALKEAMDLDDDYDMPDGSDGEALSVSSVYVEIVPPLTKPSP